MIDRTLHHLAVAMLATVLITAGAISARAEEPAAARRLSYTRDIQPILATHCFNCHGLDEHSREAARRLVAINDAQDCPLPPDELAAWTVVGSTLLCLDETISKN